MRYSGSGLAGNCLTCLLDKLSMFHSCMFTFYLVLQVVCSSESLLVLTCDRPLQLGNTGNTTGQHSSHNSKQQQQQQQASLLSLVQQTSRLSSNAAVAAAAAGDISMQGVDWVDVEGQGPFYCPAPRTGGGRRVSDITSTSTE
jgi:hypothetical protein